MIINFVDYNEQNENIFKFVQYDERKSISLRAFSTLTERKVNICFLAQGLNTIVDGKPDATAKVCGVSVWTVQKVKGILEATR